jgi:hypothetical protein
MTIAQEIINSNKILEQIKEMGEVSYPLGEDSIDPTIEVRFSDGSALKIGNPEGAVYDTFMYEI